MSTSEIIDFSLKILEQAKDINWTAVTLWCLGSVPVLTLGALVTKMIKENNFFKQIEAEANFNLVADNLGSCVALRAEDQGVLPEANQRAIAVIQARQHQNN